MQQLIVGVVVIACVVYTVWALMPSSAKNWIRRVVLHRPTKAAEGCGACGGCAAPEVQAKHVVRVVRR